MDFVGWDFWVSGKVEVMSDEKFVLLVWCCVGVWCDYWGKCFCW